MKWNGVPNVSYRTGLLTMAHGERETITVSFLSTGWLRYQKPMVRDLYTGRSVHNLISSCFANFQVESLFMIAH